MKSYLFIFHFIAVFKNVQSFILNANPEIIEPGETKLLQLNCSFISNDFLNMKHINSVILSHKYEANSPEYKDLASICSYDGQVKVIDEIGEAFGEIDRHYETYLSFERTFPYFHMAGFYKCDVNGIDLFGRPLTLSATVNVSVSELSLRSLSEQLRILKMKDINEDNKIEALQTTVSNLFTLLVNTTLQKMISDMVSQQVNKTHTECAGTDNCADLKVRLDNITTQVDSLNRTKTQMLTAMKTNYYESDIYEGKRYHLAKILGNNFDIKSAELTCELYGGHLAEIDNVDEWNFVRDFVMEYGKFYVWISGTDELKENVWLSSFSDKIIKFLKFTKTRINTLEFNCLILNRDISLYMQAYLCKRSNIDLSLYAYLCEISEGIN